MRMLCGLLILSWVAGVPGSSVATAQDTTSVVVAAVNRDHYGLGLGLGLGSEDIGGNVNLNYQHGVHLASLRLAATSGLFDYGLYDVALLYGRGTRPTIRSPYRAAVGLGIALADGCPGGSVFSDCVDQPMVVGLPLEARLAWLPAKTIGVELYGFANFNHIQSFAGLTLGLQVGSLR